VLGAGSAWWRSQRLPVGAGQSAVSGLGSQQCRRVTVGGGRTPRALAARVGRECWVRVGMTRVWWRTGKK
jgi:hypothetical protein